MKTLFINACVREESRTRQLAYYYLEKNGMPFEELDLEKERAMPLDRAGLLKRGELLEQGKTDDPFFRNANQFREAGEIVIAAPYWDLSIPAILKDYIETINVVGLTFQYVADDVPRTLSKVRKLVFLTTAGGTMINDDYGYGYLKAVFKNFFEVKDFAYFKAEKLDLYGAEPERILAETRAEIDRYFAEES